MSERPSRRRLRLRRKRKGETFASRFSDGSAAERSDRSTRRFDPLDAVDGAEVVGHMGCCVVEAIGSAAVLVALLSVPTYFLIR